MCVKKVSILERLSDNQIVSFKLRKDKKSIQIFGSCDDYFGDELYKVEFIEFIAELQVITDKMV